MLQGAREHLGEAFGRPAVGVVHAHDRALVAEEHDLLAANAEDLTVDVAGRVARQEHRDRRDVGGRELLDLLHARFCVSVSVGIVPIIRVHANGEIQLAVTL